MTTPNSYTDSSSPSAGADDAELDDLPFAGDTDADNDSADSYPDDDSDDTDTDVAGSQRSTRKRTGPDRSLIRRSVGKAVEVAAAPVKERELLAFLLGCRPTVESLATEIMCAPRGALSVIGDLEELVTSDLMDAVVTASSWEKPRATALWNLLTELGALKGTRPPAEVKAAVAMVKAVQGISSSDTARLAKVSALAKRT